MEKYCENCNNTKKTYKESFTDMFKVKDTQVKATITLIKCSQCNQEVFDKKNEINNDVIVFDEYKKAKSLMTSKEIKSMRRQYGISQSTLSKILGFGVKTVTRYENGAIQDKTHDNLLKLLKIESNFIALWKINKSVLSELENNKIYDQLYRKLNHSFEYNYYDKHHLSYGTAPLEGGIYSDWQ